MTEPTTDIAIIGGGAAGLAAAIALARAGWEPTLVAPSGQRPDGRTVALMHGSVVFLKEIGAWDHLAPVASPLVRLSIIDDTGGIFRAPPVTFDASELDLDAFGENVESAQLVAGLEAVAAGIPAIRRVHDLVDAIEPDADGVTLVLATGKVLRCRLAVGADGRNSKVRDAAGITTQDWRYDQSAVTAILAHDRPHKDTSTEFHTRTGPFTLVPMAGKRSSLVWLTTPREAERLVAMPSEAFAQTVERQAHSMLGKMRLDGPRGAVPMGGLSVDHFAAARCALVGEAAHVFPPIGAQGLNLGLRDVAALADSVGAPGGDPGTPDRLASYDGKRRADVRSRTFVVDAMNRSLLAGWLPVDALRGAGLIAVSSIRPLRRAVMKQGLGA